MKTPVYTKDWGKAVKEIVKICSAENGIQIPQEVKNPVMRSVLLIPRFSDSAGIEQVRREFDPAYEKVKPHITLVFPFSSVFTSMQVRDAVVSCMAGISPFCLTLSDVIVKGSFLFLLPVEGKDIVIKMFRSLYNGLFSPYIPHILLQEEFIPHMTIGTCTEESAQVRLAAARSMLGKYTAFIDTVSVEIIGDNSQSIIESEIPLIV
jgi:2'-5' RNA ligase